MLASFLLDFLEEDKHAALSSSTTERYRWGIAALCGITKAWILAPKKQRNDSAHFQRGYWQARDKLYCEKILLEWVFETVEPFIRGLCFQAKLSGICLLCPGVFNPALQPAFDTLRNYHATFRGPLVLLPSRHDFAFYIMSPLLFRQAVRGTQHSSSCLPERWNEHVGVPTCSDFGSCNEKQRHSRWFSVKRLLVLFLIAHALARSLARSLTDTTLATHVRGEWANWAADSSSSCT